MKCYIKQSKKVKYIKGSVPFYTISIFFAHFIHMHMMTNPNLFHAICALLLSFSISFCFIYSAEHIIDWVFNFQQNLLSESKASKNVIEEQRRIIEDQRKQLADIDKRITDKIFEAYNIKKMVENGYLRNEELEKISIL